MRRLIALAVTGCAVVAASPTPVHAEPRDVSPEKLRKAVTLGGLEEHLRAFQKIGSANGNTRATGTPGYEASVEYVISRLEKAGHRVTTPLFNHPVWRENTPAKLTRGARSFTSSPSSASGTAVDMITFGFAQSGTLAVVLVAAGCGGRAPPPEPPPEVRAAAQAYLDAFVRGDSEAACRLLSPPAVKDSGYGSIAECARDRRVEPGRVDRIPILEIESSRATRRRSRSETPSSPTAATTTCR